MAIKWAQGRNNNCASNVPPILAITIYTIYFRKDPALTFPNTASSVNTDKCGSINNAINTVAKPATSTLRVIKIMVATKDNP
ncbi:hypothetical protein CLV51_101624 [Chitinophaga niastensis]|uniref:Uncharacterized protein n=1 Tax=Chitinophaga niastensis TaxID=536980 RepID=A0A2P8HSV5_CHINA|nr:hypothetical protein CLV51_101624 [Chitinophaga niastensis]